MIGKRFSHQQGPTNSIYELKGELDMSKQSTPKRRKDGSRVEHTSGKSRSRAQKTTTQREVQESRGRSLRAECPRSSHSNAKLPGSGRDPLSLIEQSNKGRVKNLLPI